MVIKWSVSNERGSVVDFQDIRLAHFIKHYIDAQYVEAHVPHFVLGLAEAILMGNKWMP